jgi:hypothetical protein
MPVTRSTSATLRYSQSSSESESEYLPTHREESPIPLPEFDDMATPKVTLSKLNNSMDWPRWINEIKLYASEYNFWEYIDPGRISADGESHTLGLFSTTPNTTQETVKVIPPEPIQPEDDAEDRAWRNYAYKLKSYDKLKHIKGNIDAMISDSIANNLKGYIDGTFDTHMKLVNLQSSLKLNDLAFRRQIAAESERLMQGNIHQSPDNWLHAYQKLYIDSTRDGMIIPGYEPHNHVQNFTHAIAKMNPIGHQGLVNLRLTRRADGFPDLTFQECIHYFRETYDYNQYKHQGHLAFATLGDQSTLTTTALGSY